MTDGRPLVAHIIHRLDYGGLENGLVNLVNRMPPDRYRHAIVCLTGYTEFRRRVERDDVEIFALDKREGKDLGVYLRLWKLLKRLRPVIVHSRNFGTMDCAIVAWLAGVPVRIHGEHGWDIVNLHGENRRYRRLRKLFDVAVTHYVVVSAHLGQWLVRDNGVAAARVTRIINGVDTDRFRPRSAPRSRLPDELRPPERIVFGTVGRMHPVKNQTALVRAFARILRGREQDDRVPALVLVGDGPLLADVQALAAAEAIEDYVWLAGARDDVPELLRELDVFVLPSLNEGISNTILEAMASGVPVIAANVGGNPELVEDAKTGWIAPDSSETALADAMERYLADPATIARHGDAGRRLAVEKFAIDSMVANYVKLYDSLLVQ